MQYAVTLASFSVLLAFGSRSADVLSPMCGCRLLASAASLGGAASSSSSSPSGGDPAVSGSKTSFSLILLDRDGMCLPATGIVLPVNLGSSGCRPLGVRWWIGGLLFGVTRRCPEGISEAYCKTLSTDIIRVPWRASCAGRGAGRGGASRASVTCATNVSLSRPPAEDVLRGIQALSALSWSVEVRP